MSNNLVPIKIKFENKNHPKSFFDLVRLQDVISNKHSDSIWFDYHKLSFYALLIITEGAGVHGIDFKDFTFEKHTVFALKKDCAHRFYKGEAKGYLLLFTEDFIIQYLSKQEADISLQLFNTLLILPKIELDETTFSAIEGLLHQIKREYHTQQDVYAPSILRSLLHIILVKLFRVNTTQGKVFSNQKYLTSFITFHQLIEKHCFESKTVMFYATKMGVSPRTLNNLTHKIYNTSAKALVDEILLTQIKRLLINSSQPINEIAYQVGFEEVTNFFKYFKKNTGHTPARFRKSILS